jgi:hypothetical protein
VHEFKEATEYFVGLIIDPRKNTKLDMRREKEPRRSVYVIRLLGAAK